MRGRAVLAGVGLVVGAASAAAQFPQSPPAFPPPPSSMPSPFPPRSAPGAIPGPLTLSPSPIRTAAASIPVGGIPGTITPGSPNFPRSPGFPEPRPLPPAVTQPQPIPQPQPFAQPPLQPQPPAPTPTPALTQPPPASPNGATPFVEPLPYPEERVPLNGSVMMRRIATNWQVCAGARVLRDMGENEAGAKEVVRVIRELRATDWVTIGGPRPVLEYGLAGDRPPLVGGFPNTVTPVDIPTVRAEPVRGVWCLRDDHNILVNFGLRRQDAEQAAAVVRRYGFNRLGTVGGPVPVMTYLFASLDDPKAGKRPTAAVPVDLQAGTLTRTGIAVPGLGFVGESVRIDPRKVEVRRDGFEWVVAHGPEVIARFGPSEWQARDALRVIQDGRFNEFCRFGSAGLTFFLVDGRAPTRVPFAAQGQRYEVAGLQVRNLGPRWSVTDEGRPVFDVSGPEEGEALIRLLRHFRFDQVCQVGQAPRTGMVFLARSR